MKIAIKSGAIIAVVIGLINSFFLDLFGIEYEFVRMYSGFFPFIILAVGLFFAIKKSKEVVYHNEINFGQAIYSGIVIAAFAGLFTGIINFLYFQIINPNYVEEVIKFATPLMLKEKLKPAEISMQINNLRETYKPINQLTANFVIILIAGALFSAVISAILRTKDTFTHIFPEKE